MKLSIPGLESAPTHAAWHRLPPASRPSNIVKQASQPVRERIKFGSAILCPGQPLRGRLLADALIAFSRKSCLQLRDKVIKDLLFAPVCRSLLAVTEN